MRSYFEVDPNELLETVTGAIDDLAPGSDSPVAVRVRSLIEEARRMFVDAARPRGVYQSIERAQFDEVFRGDGGNDDETALEVVLEDAVSLALFAVTLGEEVSEHISEYFAAGDGADGYILDQVASIAADQLVQIARRRYSADDGANAGAAVLPYSPGYCGWNVTGQRALFARLEPADLGISLNESCLMHPIKSVSGVLVAAPIEAHDFSPSFPCCATCTTIHCQDRVASIRAELATSQV
jgi:hypothetical protein